MTRIKDSNYSPAQGGNQFPDDYVTKPFSAVN
jgi:hypothetical protein